VPRFRVTRRLRVLLATRPLAYWSLTLVVATATGLVIARTARAADTARHAWGDMASVVVASRPLAAGDPVDASDAVVRLVPMALVPDGALTELPPGTPAAAPIGRGEILTAARVGRGGRSPTAALLPDGTRGVAVPLPAAALPLAVGDTVDVVTADRVVAGALVILVGDSRAVVAVTPGDATIVARAVDDGQAAIVLAP
jgi:Flp pilus assembly protein CpaB